MTAVDPGRLAAMQAAFRGAGFLLLPIPGRRFRIALGALHVEVDSKGLRKFASRARIALPPNEAEVADAKP